MSKDFEIPEGMGIALEQELGHMSTKELQEMLKTLSRDPALDDLDRTTFLLTASVIGSIDGAIAKAAELINSLSEAKNDSGRICIAPPMVTFSTMMAYMEMGDEDAV